MAALFWFPGFWWEITVNIIEDPLYVLSHLSLATVKFLFVFFFWQFDCDVSSSLGVCWTSWTCRLIFISNLGGFQQFFKKVLFLVSLSLLSFWNSHYVYIGKFGDVSQVSQALFIFLLSFFFIFLLSLSLFFFFFVSQTGLYHLIFMFMDSFLNLIKSVFEPL